jgi:hypothetical protein
VAAERAAITANQVKLEALEGLERTELAIRGASGKGYPGITVPAPAGGWNLATFGAVTAELHNAGERRWRSRCASTTRDWAAPWVSARRR